MADTQIQKGWLTDFNDQLFAPYTLANLVLMKDDGTALDSYVNASLTSLLSKINNTTLQVDLTSDDPGKFQSNSAVSLGVSGILDIGNGGTGLDAITTNCILYGDGSDKVGLLAPAAGILSAQDANSAPQYLGLSGTWVAGSVAGPQLTIKLGEKLSYLMPAIPTAGTQASGIVTNEPQEFAGLKTFTAGVNITNNGLTVIGGINASSANITNVKDPVNALDATNKQYVDNINTNLSSDISKLANVVGDSSDTALEFTHEVRLGNLEAYQSRHESEFDTLQTYIDYDAFGDALYIIGGKDSNGDTIIGGAESSTAPVFAYFNNTGIHAIDLTVDGTTFSNITSRVGTAEGNITTIFQILGETSLNATKGDHYTRLNNIDISITGLGGRMDTEEKTREEADKAFTSDLEGLQAMIEGAQATLEEVDTKILSNILGETIIDPPATTHSAQLADLYAKVAQEISDRGSAIDDLIGNINKTTLQVNLTSDTAGTFTINSAISLGVTGILDVSNGGTGKASFIENGIIIGGNGTAALSQITTDTGLLLKNSNGALSFGGAITLSATEGTTAGPVIGYTLTSSDNAINYTGSGITIPSASADYSGVVTIGEQTFAGSKTFNGALTVGDQLTANSAARFNGNVFFESYIGSALVPSTGYSMLLGNSSYPWGSAYMKELIVKDSGGTGLIKSGSAGSSITLTEDNMTLATPTLILNGETVVLGPGNYGTLAQRPATGVEGQIYFVLTE